MEIVMQGDVLAPLIFSLQADTMGKECLDMGKHLYYYKDKVPIPPLGPCGGFVYILQSQPVDSKQS